MRERSAPPAEPQACAKFLRGGGGWHAEVVGGVITAAYIGFGVSMTIHWFSDFVAGALVGTADGIVVGNRFPRV